MPSLTCSTRTSRHTTPLRHHRHRGGLLWTGRGSRCLRELHEAFEELSFEAEEFIVAKGGEIVAFIHVRGRGRGSRIEIDNRIAHVWTYRDDKAVRLVVYEEPVEALETLGLSAQDAHAES
jgi:ketosteroid isomerase-like protein